MNVYALVGSYVRILYFETHNFFYQIVWTRKQNFHDMKKYFIRSLPRLLIGMGVPIENKFLNVKESLPS